MDLIYQWLHNNLDIVFFIYGLAFVVMGVATWVQPKRESELKLASILWLLVAYALIHAPTDFLSIWAIKKDETLHPLGQILTFISYLFLFEFGRRFMGLSKRTLAWWALPLIASGILIVSALSTNVMTTANILMGYFIRFPAGVMAGLAFFLYYNSDKKVLESSKVKRYFYAAGVSMLMWAFFCGLVRAKGGFFPANWLNADSFSLAVKIPLQLFRTIPAIIATWAIIGILKVFDWEAIGKLQKEIAERRQTEAALMERTEELESTYRRLVETQAQLVQAGKMVAMGELAADVAHELNQPLTGVLGFSQVMLSEVDAKSPLRKDLLQIEEQSKRMSCIIENVRTFARQSVSETKPIDLNTPIEKAFNLTQQQLKSHNIELVKDLSPRLPPIKADSNQLQQVFLNLIANARDALDATEKEAKRLTITTKVKNGKVSATIADNGCGMAREVAQKAFEPFFSTKHSKSASSGLGLGLSISYGIIKNHSGDMKIASQKGKGTAVIVALPITKTES